MVLGFPKAFTVFRRARSLPTMVGDGMREYREAARGVQLLQRVRVATVVDVYLTVSLLQIAWCQRPIFALAKISATRPRSCGSVTIAPSAICCAPETEKPSFSSEFVSIKNLARIGMCARLPVA